MSAFDKAIVVKEALREWEELRAEELASIPYFSDTTRRPETGIGRHDLVRRGRRSQSDGQPGQRRTALLGRRAALKTTGRRCCSGSSKHVLDHTAQDAFLAEHPPILERAIMRPFDGVAVPADHPVIASLVEGHRAALGRTPEITGFDAATDSMIFNLYTDTPAVVYGPTGAGFHSPDEYVEIDGLVDCTKTLALTILDFCGHDQK